MEVTEIRVFIAEEDRLKAYVTVTFDNCFVVRDLKIINGNNGLFVAMPSKKKKDGSYKDIAHPINSQYRNYLEKLILEKYNDEMKMVEAGFPIKREEDEVAGETVMPPEPTDLSEIQAGVGPAVTKPSGM